MTNRKLAQLLRSMASAIEHGRHSSFERKMQQAGMNWNDPYVLVTVSGGVADVAQNEGNVSVDILDFDNLEQACEADAILSDKEWAYLKKNNAELYEFFAPSRERLLAEQH